MKVGIDEAAEPRVHRKPLQRKLDRSFILPDLQRVDEVADMIVQIAVLRAGYHCSIPMLTYKKGTLNWIGIDADL